MRHSIIRTCGVLALLLPMACASQAEPGNDGPPLAAYVGKYVHDKVGGVAFLDHPKVRAAIEASGAPADAKELLRETDAVVTPLIRVGDDRLYARGFEAASGGDVNWGLLIAADGSVAAVCYSQPVDRNSRTAEWYVRGEKAFSLSEMCPSEAEEMTDSFGTWPIGPIPG